MSRTKLLGDDLTGGRVNIDIGQRTLLAKTCMVCGIFKQARDFARTNTHYRTSYCHSCKNLMGRPIVVDHQNKSLEVAVKTRQPWTEQELSQLIAMAERGLTGPQMALALNRTLYSVYTKKNRILKEI